MAKAEYTFKTIPPEWRNCEAWPLADLSACRDSVQDRFHRLARGIRLYLSSGKLKAASLEADCSASVLLHQLNRCLIKDETGELIGWRGLISGLRIKDYERSKELPSGITDNHLGRAGALTAFLLLHPEVYERFRRALQSGGSTTIGVKRSAPTLQGAWQSFRRILRDLGFSESEYPLNSESRGRRSVQRLAKKLVSADPKSIGAWYGEQARRGLLLGRGKYAFDFARAPLDVAHIDAHKSHCIGVVRVPGPAGMQAVAINRLWISLVQDHGSRAIFGYSASISKEISAATIENAFAMAQSCWQPRSLQDSKLKYKVGAGLPVGSVTGLSSFRPCVVIMDNATQHYANRIVHSLRKSLGCAISYGPIAAWWRNAILERLFKTLEQHGFQCLPSSTGSNPTDPLKPDSVKMAIEHGIDWEDLLDILDVLVANYNASPQRGLGGQTPLQVLDSATSSGTFILPRLKPPVSVLSPKLGVVIESRPVRGSMKKGHLRRPYVQIDKVHYTNEILSKRFDLIGSRVIVHLREEEDIRHVDCFLENGEHIGPIEVIAQGWRATKHTRSVRRAINESIERGDINSDSDDLVSAYLSMLADRVRQDILTKPNKVSAAGSALAETLRVTDAPMPPKSSNIESSIRKSPGVFHLPAHIKSPSWKKAK